nr:immunoglobulin heavy chain junction region [Mus musculus]
CARGTGTRDFDYW